MTEILQSPNGISSSSSSVVCLSSPTADNDGLQRQQQETHLNNDPLNIYTPNVCPVAVYRRNTEIQEEEEEEVGRGRRRERKRREREEGDQLSLLAVLATVLRKSLVACTSEHCEVEVEVEIEEQLPSSSSSSSSSSGPSAMEIGWPTNVRHVAHVTFDRFNGFLGLPVEFEPEVPRRPPSASTRVFGVSTECMQLSFDSRGNSVPTILLMMQGRLYAQGGLQAEGIFRINAENGQEEYVREQLNSGVVPDDIDVHCLAGLIKAWFRELPQGLLDSLSPEEVMHAQSEEECVRLVRLLPPTEAALMDWAVNLMADVAEMEHLNKMNARNVAMVFAPNMTQMADPLTALMYAVQVMNFLKTLIVRTLRDREESVLQAGPAPHLEPSDENGHHSTLPVVREEETNEVDGEEQILVLKELPFSSSAQPQPPPDALTAGNHEFLNSIENIIADRKDDIVDNRNPDETEETKKRVESDKAVIGTGKPALRTRRTKTGQSSNSSSKKGSRKLMERSNVQIAGNPEKAKESSIFSRLNSQTDRAEAWR